MWLVRLVPVETRYRFHCTDAWSFPLSALLPSSRSLAFLTFRHNTASTSRCTVVEMQAKDVKPTSA